MAITVGSLTLPEQLVWSDEQWCASVQTVTFGLTGVPILSEAVRQAGRPITLAGLSDGGSHTAMIQRAQTYRGWSSLQDLEAALYTLGARFTLTLNDGRAFTVAPRQDGEGPLIVEPLAVVKSFPPANPPADAFYILRAVRFITVPT